MSRSLRNRSRGQALAEVALVAPLFFLMVFGIIDIGRVVWANDVVAGAAREGARFASVNAATAATINQTAIATKDDIRTAASDHVIAGGTNVTVTVCFSTVKISSQQQGCSGDVDETVNGTPVGYERGNLVRVVVTSRVPTIIRSIFGAGDWVVSGESTVLINN